MRRSSGTSSIAQACLGVAFVLTASSSVAQDAPRMIILDRNLARTPANLEHIGPTSIQYLDASGRPRSIDRARAVAIYSRRTHAPSIPTAPTPTTTPSSDADTSEGLPGLLRLTDGQVLPGFIVPGEKSSESVTWRSRRIGTFNIKLDRISSIALADSLALLPPATKHDLLLLTNDDRMEGFVESIGQEIAIDLNGSMTNIPIDRLSAARLANPLAPGVQPLVFLSDGTILAASELTAPAVPKGAPSPKSTTVLWSLASDSGTGVLDVASIDAVLFDPRVLLPLASLPIASSQGLDERPWTPKPEIAPVETSPLGLASITISGPIQLEWKLPPGTKRFGAALELPPDARPWGNVSILISAAGRDGKFREILKKDLTSDAPTADAAFDLSGEGTLRIEVRGKTFSDVQARLRLLEPAILIAPEPAKAAMPGPRAP